MTPYDLYTEYAIWFAEITRCEPMTFDEWLMIPEDQRPLMDDSDFRSFPDEDAA